jgi:hypothetical protein
MENSRDRVGIEPLLDGRHGVAKHEAASSVTDVEEHAAGAGLLEVVEQPPLPSTTLLSPAQASLMPVVAKTWT